MRDEHARQPQAAGEIDVNDKSQCIYWTHELGVTAGELKAAVHNVGPNVEEVRRYIKERTLPPFGRDPLRPES